MPLKPHLLAAALLPLHLLAQEATRGDRNAVNTAARPGEVSADSPVAFPREGPLPALFPPDVREQASPVEKDYFLFTSPCRSEAQIRSIRAAMPPGRFTPPTNDWRHLERTRRILRGGGTLRVMAVGDSIVNDTMRSGWIASLRREYPRADIRATVYVRGGGGCQHYREEDRVARVIAPLRPDLVFIGGISQRSVEDIAAVVDRLRALVPGVEFVLGTGAFGTVDPRNPAALAVAPHSGTGPYGRALARLAAEKSCAYIDFTGPWAEYVRSSGLHPHRFHRDLVHANEYGEQILARVFMAFWRDDKPVSTGPGRVLLDVEGWRVRIRGELLAGEAAGATDRALTILQSQLRAIVAVVPEPAVRGLRRVPLYLSPPYPGVPPRAEYHPDADWLRAHWRDPDMAGGVEFTGIPEFEAETERMPMFVLHELAHARHDRELPGGFENAELRGAHARAVASGKYDRVRRHNGGTRPETNERAYALESPMQFFAEITEAYFGRNDFFPFDRSDLLAHDPRTAALVARLWGVEGAAAPSAGAAKP